MKFYILCKNEAANIRKCIVSLLACGFEVVVLDSGSTDGTLNIVSEYPVTLRLYHYSNHCNAYNEITTEEQDPYCGIIDADMEITPALAIEIRERLTADALIAPITMFVVGLEMSQGSLCPPKPIVFRTGVAWFESLGHGERLISSAQSILLRQSMPHNDLKPYSAYLSTQARYAENFISRAGQNQLSWRDRLRLKTPLLILITPLYSLLIKGGIFYKTGWVYAIDRLIAEAVMYRRSLLEKIKRGRP